MSGKISEERRIKNAVLSHRRQERHEQRLYAEAAGLSSQPTVTVWGSRMPATRVCVLVTSYNYSQYLPLCISSALSQMRPGDEINVVDDASTDQSAKLAKDLLSYPRSFRRSLIRLPVNSGLCVARNLGLKLASAPFVLILDADNQLAPSALDALADRLSASSAAFSFGTIQCFGDRTDQRANQPWNVELLLQRNYLDAMAMFRRRTVLALGGYDVVHDRDFGGWEDYGLYLALAESGATGVWIDQVIGYYRAHAGSMSEIANLASADTFAYLRRKYSSLAWPPPAAHGIFDNPS